MEDFVDYSEITDDNTRKSSSNEDENIDDVKGDEERFDYEQPKEKEPLDFSLLPLDLQCDVVNKFEFRELTRFERTSRLANNACCEETHSLPFEVSKIYVNKKTTKMCINYDYELQGSKPLISYHTACESPVKIHATTIKIPARITSGRMRKVAKLFEKNQTTAMGVFIDAHIKFRPEDLNYLLKVTSAEYFSSTQFLSRPFFQQEQIQKMPKLFLGSSGCSDEELVKLYPKHLELRSDFITSRGINKFLRQWKRVEEGEYTGIEYIQIRFGTTNKLQNFESVFEGLDANPVWTPQMHGQSILGGLPLESLNFMRPGDPVHIYSLWRPKDIDQRMIISLCRDEMEACVSKFNEAKMILQWLSKDQYYALLNKCKECGLQFCKHRRRYSTAQLKKCAPRIHGVLLNGFLALGTISAATGLLQWMTGERPFTRVQQFGFEMLQQETGLAKAISSLRCYILDSI